jgi:hypothetical protein
MQANVTIGANTRAVPQQEKRQGPPLDPSCPLTKSDIIGVMRARRRMEANGYYPICINGPWSDACPPYSRGKAPLGKEWQNGHAPWQLWGDPNSVWAKVAPNSGILLGVGEAPVQAIDIDGPAIVAAILDLVARHLPAGGIVRLRRNSPRLAILFRCELGAVKQKVKAEHGAVERQAQGQQLVVHGWHPSGVRYLWQRPRAPWTVPAAELPLATEMQIEAFLDAVEVNGFLGAKMERTAAHKPKQGEKRHQAEATIRCGEPAEELRHMLRAHNGQVVPAVLALVWAVGARGTFRHDTLVTVTGYLVHRGWPAPSITDLLLAPVNEHFRDGDWAEEIRRAIAHAEGRQLAAIRADFENVVDREV